MSNRISKIRVKGVDYEVRSKRSSVTKTINSLSSIPVDVESIVANISSSTSFSLASNMNKGDHIDLLCIPSSDFQQEISGDNIKTAFGGKISVKNGQPFKLYINCYDTNKIFIDASNVEIVSSMYTITFNITPPDATVNYSIDSESYDQTTTGTGTVSNVPHGSTLYYKISKSGYETITKSQVVNSDTNNVTVTESMNPAYYILVSTNSSSSTEITKYTDQEGTETEQITIPAGSTDYKVDGLMYGFKISSNKGAYITKLDTTYFNTSNVTIMRNMFYMCNLLTSLDLSSFDTSNVTDMGYMFSSCSALTSLDLSNFDTSNVTRMLGMFTGCFELTSLDLSNFDTSKVTSMNGMFSGCNKLTHIKCKQAFKDWCWTKQNMINLPAAMRDGGSGTWEIVD